MPMHLYSHFKTAVAKVEKVAYEVVQPFHHLHVLQEVGTVLMLAAEEAKYHLLADRIKPVGSKTVAVAPAVDPAVTPAPVDEAEHDDHAE